MKVIFLALFAIVAVHPVVAKKKGNVRSLVDLDVLEDEKIEDTLFGDAGGGGTAMAQGGDGQACSGCTEDAIRAIEAAVIKVKPKVLPLAEFEEVQGLYFKLAKFIAQLITNISWYSIDLIHSIGGCGDCDHDVTQLPGDGYCGPIYAKHDSPASLNGNQEFASALPADQAPRGVDNGEPDHPDYDLNLPSNTIWNGRTFDCCCDVNQIRDITIKYINVISKESVATDPKTGGPLLLTDIRRLPLIYGMTAYDYYKIGVWAVYDAAQTFCNVERITDEKDVLDKQGGLNPNEFFQVD